MYIQQRAADRNGDGEAQERHAQHVADHLAEWTLSIGSQKDPLEDRLPYWREDGVGDARRA